MKILVVYVGKESRPNLEHGLRAGIWGFKDRAKPESFQTLSGDDVILLATGYTGGPHVLRLINGVTTRWKKSGTREFVERRSIAHRRNGLMRRRCQNTKDTVGD
jgi:hypothetical protein